MKRTNKTARRGFTLVEVIVTLVALGIAAAILIPSMTGWIDKAQEKKCIHEMGQVAQYYDAAVAATGFGKIDKINPDTLVTEAVKESLARTNSGFTYRDAQGNAVTITLSPDQMTVTDVHCAKHGYLHTGGAVVVTGIVNTGSSAPSNVLQEALDSIIEFDEYKFDKDGNYVKTGKKQTINRYVGSYDSNAIYSYRVPTIKDYLQNADGRLGAMNVQTWAVRNSGTGSNSNAGKRAYFFTDQNISELTAGTQVRVIKYNEATGNYTAGYITVKDGNASSNHDQPYKVLGDTSNNNTFTQSASGSVNYQDVLDVFNGLDATK